MRTAVSDADEAEIAAIRALEAQLPGSRDALLEHLSAPSWPARRAAIAVLAGGGEGCIDAVFEILRTRRENETVVAAAVDMLASARGEVDRKALEIAAVEDRPAILCDLEQILGRRKAQSAVSWLSGLVAHADDNVAVCAIEALGRLGPGAGLEAIIGAAESGQFFRTHPAIDVLARSGDPRAIAPLQRLLDDPLCALEAARALARLGDVGAIGALAAKLDDASSALTRVVASSLVELVGGLGARYGTRSGAIATLRGSVDSSAAIASLADALEDADPEERLAIATVLGWMGGDEAASTLYQLLGEPGAMGRRAVEALSDLGPAARHSLAAALREGDAGRRVRLLPRIDGSLRDAPELLACLDDDEPQVRLAACVAAARTASRAAVPRLFALLRDESPGVCHAATNAIAALGDASTEARTLEAARDPAPQVRRAAMRLIGTFGWPGAIATLLDAARNKEDERVAEAAIASIPMLDDAKVADVLCELISDSRPTIRASVCRAMAHLETVDTKERVCAALERALDDSAPWVRYYAALSLGRCGDPGVVPRLTQLLDDSAGHVRIAAIESLAILGAEESARALLETAHSSDPDLRRAALIALGIAQPAGGFEVLVAALDDTLPATRIIAIGALERWHSPSKLGALIRCAADPDPHVRDSAFGALAAIEGREATCTLVRLSESAEHADAATRALSTRVPGRIAALLETLEHAPTPTVMRVVAALSRMDHPSAHAALASALFSDRVETRRAAAAALVAVASQEARPFLERASEVDSDPEVRRLASHGLQLPSSGSEAHTRSSS